MLTATLEKLILSGNATYNTFVIGGTEKHILNVPSNRFIVITDITYFSQLNTKDGKFIFNLEQIIEFEKEVLNTQLKVFSNKSNNHFIFRNNISIAPYFDASIPIREQNFLCQPFGSTKLDTFLIHESDVSFTFSYAGQNLSQLVAATPVKSIAYQPPLDYGKGATAINVKLVGNSNPTGNFYTAPVGTVQKFVVNEANALQLMFPIDTNTKIQDTDNPNAYPLALVSYVEINGNPTNISATL
jgi:hypothetical protein